MRLFFLALLTSSMAAAACGGRSVSTVQDAAPLDAVATDAHFRDAHVPPDVHFLDGHMPTDARPDAGALCSGLSLAQCRQANGCTPDLCFACSCTPSFEQCRSLSDPPFHCPEYDCPQPPCCLGDSDCTMTGATCAPPGTDYPCGICDPDPGNCTSDQDCGTGDICEPVPCTCSGASHCVPGCTQPADCGVGTTCSGGDHPRCAPSACGGPSAPCPPDFDCDGGACARRPCTSDLECDHFCVQDQCYDSFGVCQMPGA